MKDVWYRIQKLKVAICVTIFLVVLVVAKSCEGSELKGLPRHGPYLELNRTTFNSEITIGGVGYRTKSQKWDLALQYLGEGNTAYGYQRARPMVSISRLVWPGWKVYKTDYFMRLGIGHTPDQQLIGDTTFRLGFGFRYDFLEIEVGHHSSADLWDVNKGLDYIGLRFMLN